MADHWGTTDATPLPFGGGVGVASPDGRGWLLVDLVRQERDPLELATAADARPPAGWLGGAVIWGQRHSVRELHVLCDGFGGADARRAQLFRSAPMAWRVTGRSVERVEPEPCPPDHGVPIDVLAFAGLIEECGAEAVVEDGVLRAEVVGLEVGRVVSEPDDGSLVLEVGVGRHDRLANQIMNADLDTEQALRRAVDAVRRRRRGDAGAHPANQLMPERWLRWILCRRPDLVGADRLEPISGTEPARFKHPMPAVAAGVDRSGHPLVVGCSVGIDLDAIAYAADARERHTPGARLVLCVPTADHHAVLDALAGALKEPAQIAEVPGHWRTYAP